MLPVRLSVYAAVLSGVFAPNLYGQAAQAPSQTPMFRINSNLVFLDVTVLDKKGNPVDTGLTRDDFTILEDKEPQKIFSFEAPQAHAALANPADDNSDGKVPVTIFVLDLLNSRRMSFAYIHEEMQRYLKEQPDRLPSPTEIMVLGNTSLDTLQGFTRDKAELLDAVDHMPPVLPLKLNNMFGTERFVQSDDALQEIAMQNQGLPGRKNVIWIGPGGPGIVLSMAATQFGPKMAAELKAFAHFTTNLLVNARITLFVVYPGVRSVMQNPLLQDSPLVEGGDPMSIDMGFPEFAQETGGRYYFDRNFADLLIKRALVLGSNYYTLTYQPHDVEPDGKFRQIEVKVRNPNYHVVTKDGYYDPETDEQTDPRNSSMMALAAAVRSDVQFSNIGVAIGKVVRHPDTGTATLTVQLKVKSLNWLATGDGKSTTNLTLAAASLNGQREIEASRMVSFTLDSNIANPRQGPDEVADYQLTLRVPRKTRFLRVIAEDKDGNRMGSAELTSKQLAASAEAPTPAPQLAPTR